jgi:sodium borate transporter 11
LFVFFRLFYFVDFQKNFNSPQCRGENAITNITNSLNSSLSLYSWNETKDNGSVEALVDPKGELMGIECNQASSVLFLLLMLGTVWLGVSIFNFKKT